MTHLGSITSFDVKNGIGKITVQETNEELPFSLCEAGIPNSVTKQFEKGIKVRFIVQSDKNHRRIAKNIQPLPKANYCAEVFRFGTDLQRVLITDLNKLANVDLESLIRVFPDYYALKPQERCVVSLTWEEIVAASEQRRFPVVHMVKLQDQLEPVTKSPQFPIVARIKLEPVPILKRTNTATDFKPPNGKEPEVTFREPKQRLRSHSFSHMPQKQQQQQQQQQPVMLPVLPPVLPPRQLLLPRQQPPPQPPQRQQPPNLQHQVVQDRSNLTNVLPPVVYCKPDERYLHGLQDGLRLRTNHMCHSCCVHQTFLPYLWGGKTCNRP